MKIYKFIYQKLISDIIIYISVGQSRMRLVTRIIDSAHELSRLRK